MILLISLIGFISTFVILDSLFKFIFKKRLLLISRLDTIKGKNDIEEGVNDLDSSFYDRILEPFYDNLLKSISRTAPSSIKEKINYKLIAAGNPFNLGVNGWILLKSACVIVLPLFFLGLIRIKNSTSINGIIFVVIIIIILYFIPNLLLVQAARKRKKRITNSLPDVLDILTVSVEAGLSFDGALARLINKIEGDLIKEFSKVLNEIKVGKNRKEALRDMSVRCDVADLTAFVGSIVQAEELGVGITNVLRIQSKQMRLKRRQRAQEKAMKAPIKILFPLIIFIFPAIFTVLLGPAMIRIIEQLGE